jgi:hypothetical protein
MKEEIVFDKFWFNKHQSKLLWLANSFIGKYIFQFKKMGHYLDPNKKIDRITPNSVRQFNGNILRKGKIRAEYTEHFFNRNEYARKLYFMLLPMWWAMHIWDWFVADHFTLAPQLSFGFSTLTVNPGSIGASNPIDGWVSNQTGLSTWASIRGGAGNQSGAAPTEFYVVYFIGDSSTNTWNDLGRSIFCFDTSALTSGATITAAVLSLYGKFGVNDPQSNTPNIDIYTSTPAATNALANGDFAQIGSTSQTGSPITSVGWVSNAYNDFTFNSTGRGNVSKTGISQFGARNANYDVANVVPTWLAGYPLTNFQCNFSGNGSNMPKLVVTYSVLVTSGNMFSLLSSL